MGDKSRNQVAAFSYLLGFITGIVIFFVEKDDKFIRFHAMQSILVTGTIFVANFVVNLFFGFVSGFLSPVITVAFLLIWIISIYKAYHGEMFKWPIFGNLAENRVK